jgi:hypothetical protein
MDEQTRKRRVSRAIAAAICSRERATRRHGVVRPTCSRAGRRMPRSARAPSTSARAWPTTHSRSTRRGYEGLLLSPVAPLGSTSVLAPTSQTARTVDDPRLRGGVRPDQRARPRVRPAAARWIPLRTCGCCTTHQVLRMQPTGRGARGARKHFRLFVMADAGPGLADDALRGRRRGRPARGLTVACSTRPGLTHAVRWERPAAIVRSDGASPALADRVVAALRRAARRRRCAPSSWSRTTTTASASGTGCTPCRATSSRSSTSALFDWVAQLTSNRRHRFVASAIGIQLLRVALHPR